MYKDIVEMISMFPLVDLHIHTKYSDGRNPIEDVIRQAELNRVKAIAITDHYHMIQPDDFKNYISEIRRFSNVSFYTKVFPGLEVHPTKGEIPHLEEILKMGIKILLFDAIDTDVSRLSFTSKEELCEHFANVYRKACALPEIKIFAHPLSLGRFNHIKYFSDVPQWLLEEFIECSIKGKKYIEIMNGMAWWFPKSPINRFTREYTSFIKEALRKGARFSMGSDTHCIQGVGNLVWSQMVLKMAGAKPEDVISLNDLYNIQF